MENIEKSEQNVVLQVNGVAVDVDVIAKDADFEMNNNETVETVEKLVKITEENLMEKSSQSADEQEEKNADKTDAKTDNGKQDNTITNTNDDKSLEGDSEVEQTATAVAEEKSDESSSSSSVASVTDEILADSESSTTLENSSENKQKTDELCAKIEESTGDTVKCETEGHASDAIADAVERTTDDAEQASNNDAAKLTATDQTEPPNVADSPNKSPSKKKSSPKKRKSRSRSQKETFDYSHLVNYTLSVTQRQRRYFLNMARGGRNIPAPSDDCEIFCSNIPINVLEQELIPLFEKFGKIFELRLMMSMRNPKRNAGFAFVRYTTDQSANEATEKLHNYEIVPGKLLSVRLSQPNLSLFVGNIHRGLTREQIHEKLGNKTQGLVKTFVKTSLYETTKNCGFCFLEYDCHTAALNAKRLLNRGNVWGRQLFVDWAQRRKQFNESDMHESKTLFINYLPKETTEHQITDTLSSFGAIEKVTKIKDYAFVLFTEHQAAIDALNGADKAKFGGEMVEISLAMPKSMKHRNRFPSFSYRRSRYNRRNNSYNRYRSSSALAGKFFMHKQPTDKANANSNDDTNHMNATTSAMADGQTVIPSMVITQHEPLVVS